jgi:aldehyde oxidoreductase
VATGKPVFLRYDYHQQMTYTGKRSPFFIKMRMPPARTASSWPWRPTGPWTTVPTRSSAIFSPCAGPSSWARATTSPTFAAKGRTVCTNHAWGSAFRAYGSPQSEFASEVLMDELAEKLGMDPLELRYKNVYRRVHHPHRPGAGSLLPARDDRHPAAQVQGALDKAKANPDGKVKKGVGISIGIYGCGLDGPDASEAWVELNPDGTVTVYACWEDHGQGADMGALGTAHQACGPGIAPENIRLVMNDTSKAPNSGPSGGSRQQVVTGQAIQNGCERWWRP